MTKIAKGKKAICTITALLILFAVATPTSVYAAEETSDKTGNQSEITSSTVVTDKNIYEVLNYVGLDSSSFTASSTADYDNITVGELKAAVDEARQLPLEIVSTSVATPSNVPALKSNIVRAASNSMTLESDFNIGSCAITFHATGNYKGSSWTSASASPAEVDSDFLIYTYKLSDQKNTTTCTSKCITLKCSGTLNTYIGVGDYGLIKIASQSYSATRTFNASDYLKK